MDRLPVIKVGGRAIDTVEITNEIRASIAEDQAAKERERTAALERDAARYRFEREHSGMPPTVYDEYVDSRIERWNRLHGDVTNGK